MSPVSGGPRVLVRCDASGQMGGGHVMRCLSLANALAEAGATVTFVSAVMPDALEKRIAEAGHALERIPESPEARRPSGQWEEPPLSEDAQKADAKATGAAIGQADWVIVDHYLLDERWHSAARAFARRILVIDDLANRSYDCDVLLDQTFGRRAEAYRNLVPGGAKILTGPAYALLRPEFARERPAALERRTAGGPAHRVLVSVGTADPDGITARALAQVLAAAPRCDVDVVLGPQAAGRDQVNELARRHPRVAVHVNSERMAELMRDADLAIGAAGTTSWERCCLGLPSVILVLAENQRPSAQALSAAGAALAADDLDTIGAKLALLVEDAAALARMSAAAFAITDGLGTSRVLRVLLDREAATGEIQVRRATMLDAEQLWLWRNDPLTRAQSRAGEPISWKDHVTWLACALDRPGAHFFIAERDENSVGTVRFHPLEDGGHEVSIAVAPELRGRGCGAELLRAVCAQMGAGAIYASVRVDNEPSRSLFESCGFSQIASAEPGFLRYLLRMQEIKAARGNKS